MTIVVKNIFEPFSFFIVHSGNPFFKSSDAYLMIRMLRKIHSRLINIAGYIRKSLKSLKFEKMLVLFFSEEGFPKIKIKGIGITFH